MTHLLSDYRQVRQSATEFKNLAGEVFNEYDARIQGLIRQAEELARINQGLNQELKQLSTTIQTLQSYHTSINEEVIAHPQIIRELTNRNQVLQNQLRLSKPSSKSDVTTIEQLNRLASQENQRLAPLHNRLVETKEKNKAIETKLKLLQDLDKQVKSLENVLR